MSETTSLSSQGFHLSLLNLAMEFPDLPSFDVDELFARDEVRQRLVEKLLGSKAERAPSWAETDAADAEAMARAREPEAEGEAEAEAEPVAVAVAEMEGEWLREEESEWAEPAAAALRLSSEGAGGEPAPPPFVPWRAFVNCVDAFNGRHVARLLAERWLGSDAPPPMPEGEAGPEEEERGEAELLGEDEGEGEEGEEGPRPRPSRRIFPRTQVEIFGSLLHPDGTYDKEIVAQIVETSDKRSLIKTLKTCGVIVYDVSRHESQIREARWILQTLQYELMLMDRWDPDRFALLTDVPMFILISPFLTWARTPPPGPFKDSDFKKRRPHPKYKDHYKLEKETIAAGKIYPQKYRTAVLCSGVTYGCEEDVLDFLFRYAWENEPALPLYVSAKHSIPLVHVQDLATMIFSVMEKFPKKRRYLLAVERGKTTIKKLTKAISKNLTTGEIVILPNDEMKYLRLSKHICECMLTNVYLEPEYFADAEKMTWASDLSIVPNIGNIIAEYLKYRKLGAKTILITGPPASGKTTLAKKLCGYYRLHYLSTAYVGERHLKNLEDKIARLHSKEAAAQERARAREGEEEAGEEAEEEEEEEEEEAAEEEEEPETVETLQEQVEELKRNLAANNGKLDEPLMLHCTRRLLATRPLRNQGYVLDGFPENVRQLRQVFRTAPGEGGEEEPPADLDEDEEEPPEDVQPFPEYVIGLDAPDVFLLVRAMEHPPGDPHYEEEAFKKRLATYRAENPEDEGVLGFMDERDVHPLLVPVISDSGLPVETEVTARVVRKHVGPPLNLGLSEEERERKLALEGELEVETGARAAEDEATAAGAAHRERMRRLEQWALTVDALRREEEQLAEAQGLALRHYLMRFILPTLARGLLEAERVRPLDPLDFLAEFLFRCNPEGQLGEPEYSAASRRFFHDLLKCREPLFQLAQLSPREEEVFFPQDVLDRPEESYDTYY